MQDGEKGFAEVQKNGEIKKDVMRSRRIDKGAPEEFDDHIVATGGIPAEHCDTLSAFCNGMRCLV